MKHRPSLAALSFAAALLPPAAFAAPPRADLTVAVSAPSGVFFDQNGRYTVTVANRGSREATGVSLTIQLPVTHTSPSVSVLGELGAIDGRCSRTGTRLVCNLGTINRGASTPVFFDIALPYSAAPLVVSATVSTPSAESSTSNNSASRTVTPLAYTVAVNPSRPTFIQHCTGTGLTSFFECELYPSSVSSHETVLNADHTITFVDVPPGYTGAWSQPSPTRLRFQYFEGGTLAATFEGHGTSPSCFEGVTTFPNSTYVAPYQVCLR